MDHRLWHSTSGAKQRALGIPNEHFSVEAKAWGYTTEEQSRSQGTW